MSRNRLRRLPNYVAYLTTLRVLKLDHNPVVWPPRDLITFTDASAPADDDDVDPQMRFQEESTARTRTRTASSSETSTAMAHWLRVLQEWMRQNPYVRPVKVVRPSTGDPSTEHKYICVFPLFCFTRASTRSLLHTLTHICSSGQPNYESRLLVHPAALIQQRNRL